MPLNSPSLGAAPAHTHGVAKALTVSLIAGLALAGCGGGHDRYYDDWYEAPAPLPAPPPSGGNTGETASVCLNEALVNAPGTTLNYRMNSTVSGQTGVLDHSETQQGQVAIDGRTLLSLSLTETETFPGRAAETLSGMHYYDYASGQMRIWQTQLTGAGSQQLFRYNPGVLDIDFGLGVGQSSSSTSSVEATDSSYNGGQAYRFQTVSTVTLTGFETVTVPAGTFVNACRFAFSGTWGSQPINSTQWIARGSGVVVRSVDSEGRVDELVSAQINNVPVTP